MKLGYPTMEQTLACSVTFARKLQQIQSEYELALSRYEGNKQCLILHKLISAFDAVVKNDVQQVQQSELFVNELKKKEQSKSSDLLNNTQIANGFNANLVVSFVKDRGRILNQLNPKMAEIFEWDGPSFVKIENIKKLMPNFISEIHDFFMENYILMGRSSLLKSSTQTFIGTQKNFIKPAKLYLDYFWGHFDDFVMIASILDIQRK